MRMMLSTVFLLMITSLFAQPSQRVIKSDNIDSLLCPKGYAALGQSYLKFTLKNKNKLVNNQTFNGKVVFINFWFEGCHPCMAEMEALNELFKQLKDNKDFVFISVTYDNQEIIKRVKEKYALSFDIFSVSSKECDRLNFGCGYPTSIVLDKTGVVKYKHSGGSIKTEEARKFVIGTVLPEIKSLL